MTIADFDSEIVEGFLHALNRADAHSSPVYSSLYFAARRHAHEARLAADRTARKLADLDDATIATLRPAVEGHPDLVLAKAVRDHGLSNDEASLIARARLGGIGTRRLANEQGLSPYQYRRKLTRAENWLMHFLADCPPRPSA